MESYQFNELFNKMNTLEDALDYLKSRKLLTGQSRIVIKREIAKLKNEIKGVTETNLVIV